ncbi:MAG: GDSL-type esterase/lipase family protein [Bacteroidota bacterium]
MKTLFYFYLTLLSLACFACEDDSSPNPVMPGESINKIMPLGASRVQGARPVFESYRYELWKLLVDADYTFDYIGTREDDANYPEFSGMEFDDDHEGRGGWTSGQILDGIEDWMSQTGEIDIVLFSSPGGNDALQGLSYDEAISNVNEIIDLIQSANPDVTIIIEQLAPGRSDIMTDELATYFDQIQSDVVEIATQQSTARSPVIAVDMATGFTDALLADAVHYNEAGAAFIADRYFAVLEDVLDR